MCIRDRLSKYGTKNEFVELDKLGSSHWQYRKASAKNKINEIAGVLIKTAAERSVNKAPLFRTQEPHYSNFLREFDHVDTEDQINVTSEILNDINSGMPMDRLICGDVGYGKTEVALRAAFNVAMNNFQVAFIVPTTLLSNQHYNNFVERFKKLIRSKAYDNVAFHRVIKDTLVQAGDLEFGKKGSLDYGKIGTGKSGLGTINSEIDTPFNFDKGSVGLVRTKKYNTEDSQFFIILKDEPLYETCLLYTSPSPRDRTRSRMPSSA